MKTCIPISLPPQVQEYREQGMAAVRWWEARPARTVSERSIRRFWLLHPAHRKKKNHKPDRGPEKAGPRPQILIARYTPANSARALTAHSAQNFPSLAPSVGTMTNVTGVTGDFLLLRSRPPLPICPVVCLCRL